MSREASLLSDALRRLGVHPELTDPAVCIPAFRAALARNLTDASLAHPMMPTYLKTAGTLETDRPVIVLDAGGTSLRTALARFTTEGPVLEELRVCAMPGRDRELSLDEYLNAMTGLLAPYLGRSDRVGYCFSYPVRMHPDGDGELAQFNKGIRVRGSEGMPVLASLREALRLAGKPVPHFTLLNDAVAAALGGLALCGGTMPEGGLFSLILGTGANNSFRVPRAALSLFPEAASFPEPYMFVNPETAFYDVFPAGVPDADFFGRHPEMQFTPFMQKVAGAYLGPAIGLTAGRLAAEGFFTEACRARLLPAPEFETSACSEFLLQPDGSVLGQLFEAASDRALFSELCRLLIRRAARCTACALFAIMEFCELGPSEAQPATLIADGSTFWKTPGLLEETEALLNEFARRAGHGFCRIRQVEHVNLIGSAAAALLDH